jgi:integrase
VKKYHLLRNFFLFCTSRDMMVPLQLPVPRRQPSQTFAPYIYSRTEIRLLLSKTGVCQGHILSRIDAQTLSTLLLFLYGTGALTGEARRLSREDVDLKHRIVTIRNKQLRPTRRIPIGTDLFEALAAYSCAHHSCTPIAGGHFFASLNGEVISESSLNQIFQKLRRIAGIVRHDGIAHPPRMHDLRYTFAVHRLTAWHKRHADLNRMIPALSMYMGYVQLAAANRFLRLTPERFRSQLDKLSSSQAKRHWRDDAALMRFLTAL